VFTINALRSVYDDLIHFPFYCCMTPLLYLSAPSHHWTSPFAHERNDRYLLEKSRVARQLEQENNFHVLHYFVSGCKKEYRDMIECLHSADRYLYFNGAPRNRVADDKMEYDALLKVFVEVGFTKNEIEDIHTILAGVLAIGNIRFKQGGEGGEDEDASEVVAGSTVEEVAAVLGLGAPEKLATALTCKTNIVNGEIFIKTLTVHQADDARDTFAKTMYENLFSWLVVRLNTILAAKNLPSETAAAGTSSVGVLDIFGFENFAHNSFEQVRAQTGAPRDTPRLSSSLFDTHCHATQSYVLKKPLCLQFPQLCINTANEQLHHFFNQHIFAWELEEYRKEGIVAADIKFTDNLDRVTLLLGRPLGIFSMLDEEARLGRGTDESFLAKSNKHLGEQPGFANSAGQYQFGVHHYAGDVKFVKFPTPRLLFILSPARRTHTHTHTHTHTTKSFSLTPPFSTPCRRQPVCTPYSLAGRQ
jgi:myosin heavy subunit